MRILLAGDGSGKSDIGGGEFCTIILRLGGDPEMFIGWPWWLVVTVVAAMAAMVWLLLLLLLLLCSCFWALQLVLPLGSSPILWHLIAQLDTW